LLRQSAAKCVISKKQGREHTQIENWSRNLSWDFIEA
jgi:hypothetical protein